MNEFYKVEKILEKKKFDDQVLYLVKWRGYGYEDCTWEPRENLATAKESLKEFFDSPPLDKLKSKIDRSGDDADKKKQNVENYKSLKKIVEKFVLDKEREMDCKALEKEKVRKEREKSEKVKNREQSLLKRYVKQQVSEEGSAYEDEDEEEIVPVVKRGRPRKTQAVASEPLSIIKEVINKGFLINWKVNIDGSKEKPSEVSFEEAVEKFPSAVADYYEKLRDELLQKKRVNC